MFFVILVMFASELFATKVIPEFPIPLITIFGHTGMLPMLDEDMVIAGYIIRVRLHDIVSPVFFTRFMNMEFMKKQLRSMAKGAVNQANINAQELKAIAIYVPPIELQNEFADFVEQTDKSKLLVQQSINTLQTLKDKLMQDYFG